MHNLHDTQPSPRLQPRRDDGLRAPPRWLFWGVILCFLAGLLGVAGVVVGFREVLKPAQQQRVIDQLPFMRALRKPTPIGGVFPTLQAPAADGDALALLDMPLDLPAPSADATSVSVVVSAPTPTAQLATLAPTATVSSLPTATAAPPTPLPATPLPADYLPSTARIDGVLHQQQTWNNCGPATITMALSFHGWRQPQAYAGDILKPNREDKNVSPQELADFVRQESYVEAIARVGGTLDLLKRLVANGFPTVIETAAMFEGYDWIGHYRVVVGYDDAYRLFYFYDSFLGVGPDAKGVTIDYAQVDADWRAFNRAFIVVYHPEREALLRSILADYWRERDAAQLAFEAAQQEARRNPQDAFAWFNMGSSLVALGRHAEAAAAFDQATSTRKLPWRMMWYQHGAFEAYFELGRYADVLTLAAHNQNTAPELEETYYWRGRVYQAQGQRQRAASEYRRALGYNRSYDAARQALDSLN